MYSDPESFFISLRSVAQGAVCRWSKSGLACAWLRVEGAGPAVLCRRGDPNLVRRRPYLFERRVPPAHYTEYRLLSCPRFSPSPLVHYTPLTLRLVSTHVLCLVQSLLPLRRSVHGTGGGRASRLPQSQSSLHDGVRKTEPHTFRPSPSP